MILISTDEVYGSGPAGKSFSEEDGLTPSSPYSASKAAADVYVQAYHRTYGLNTTILRSTNNFGPYQFPEKLMPKATVRALSDMSIPLYGDEKQVRDWLYVLDFCEAICAVAEKGGSGDVYNVSAGNEVPNLQVAKTILQLLGKPNDLIQFVEDRPGYDVRYSLDSSKLRSELGWKPRHGFDEALANTVKWYVANKDWWRPLINEKILSPTPWK